MKLSEIEFKKVAQSHLTAGDHLKLADHFTQHALEHEHDAKIQEDLAALTTPRNPSWPASLAIMPRIRVRRLRQCAAWPKFTKSSR